MCLDSDETTHRLKVQDESRSFQYESHIASNEVHCIHFVKEVKFAMVNNNSNNKKKAETTYCYSLAVL